MKSLVSKEQWKDKDYCLDYWIEMNGKPDVDKLQRLLPRPKAITLRLWISAFARGDRNVGYPRSARKRVQEIVAVLQQIGASAEAITSAKMIADENVPLQGAFK